MSEIKEGIGFDRLSNALHEVHRPVNVVNRKEAGGKKFVRDDEVTDVRTGKVFASVTVAGWVECDEILLETGV